MNKIKYISDRWLNKPIDMIAIRCNGEWIKYQKIGLEQNHLDEFKKLIAYSKLSKEQLKDIIKTCEMLIMSIPTEEDIQSGLM